MTGAIPLRRPRVVLALAAAAVLGMSAGPAGAPAQPPLGETPSWVAARSAWRAALEARRTARWEGSLASIVAAGARAASAESLYRASFLGWTPDASSIRVPPDVLREAALDAVAWGRPDLASAILEGPLRDDDALLPLRAAALGRTGQAGQGLALLGWPEDRRLRRGETWKGRDAHAAPRLARLLTAASLSDSAGDARAARAAWEAILDGSEPGSAARELARLRLGRRLIAEGTPRLALEVLESPSTGGQALALADAHVAVGDTLGALSALIRFGTESGGSVAERFPSLLRAATIARPLADRITEAEHAALCRSLGAVGEADRALSLLAARHVPAADAAASYARAELEASLLNRARRFTEAAAAWRALASRPDLPKGAPEEIALSLARASRGGRAFSVMDSAYQAAVGLSGRGPVAARAAWERAREWEDERGAREAARVLDWAAAHVRSDDLRAAVRVHEAIAWKRAGSPDSARAAIADAPASDAMVAFWKGRLALEAGDTTAAVAAFRRARQVDAASYEGIRAGEEAARLGRPVPAERRGGTARVGERATAEDEGLETRLLDALGWGEIAADLRRSCARRGEAPHARACIDALEEAGVFRVGKRSLVPEDRFDFPAAYPGVVIRAAASEDLPPALLWAIMRQESAYDRAARSRAGALGLLQLLPATASQLAGRTVPEDSLTVPEVNVRLGARYVRNLLREFGDPRAVLASYNAGEDAVRRWIRERPAVDDEWVERIPYGETRGYVKRVYAAWRLYETIYGASR